MLKKFLSASLSLAMVLGAVTSSPFIIQANDQNVKADGLQNVASVEVDKKQNNVVWVTFGNGMKGKVTFLDNNIFRYNVDPAGEYSEYAPVRSGYPDTAKIQQYPDSSNKYAHPAATVQKVGNGYEIKAGNVTISYDDAARMTIKAKDKVVMQEKEPLVIKDSTVQTLVKNDEAKEQFFGGGTQNGRSNHTGNMINISNESGWNDGQVSSPNPFYYTTAGYGVLRNTYQSGRYDFGHKVAGTVSATHYENEFDAYYFVTDQTNPRNTVQDLLNGYFKVTGNPTLLPEYGYYLGHLNAYNRDAWSHEKMGKAWTVKGNDPYTSEGTTTYERGGTGTVLRAGETAETLNGTAPTYRTENVPEGVHYSTEFSARGRLDLYTKYDMPLGFFLPNDGYGAGYGQNGFNVTGGVNDDGSSSAERLEAVAKNVANLEDFATYAQSKGIATGLWTQSNLVPDSNPKTEWHLLRDFYNEVRAGVTTLKTDVAWVGPGYSFQLSGVKQAFDIVTTIDYKDGRDHTRPNIISLDGWAGSQRYNSVWTGDQVGGNWEYIRFHIPTFIGQGLAGNPNIGTDMDGIWGGNVTIATRDYQWKSFAPQMLDMDGWGTYMKAPYTHGDPYTGIARMYLKTKARMMPYVYTNAYAAANIDTGNNDKGLPTVRAMFLEYPNDPLTYTDLVKYQYMWGENLLIAPIYQDTDKDEDKDNDVRDGIYLPDANQVWVDYFTGEQYRGGQVINNFDAPIWKLPVFVKNGAIIPMAEENNSAYEIDRTQRFVEFWPEGSTDFTAIEDDGTFIENKTDDSDSEYGVIDNVSYGPHVSTKYTSVVENGVATLTANKATGSYKGYNQNKDTTFVVHASKAPTSLVAKNGATTLTEVVADSKAAFDAAKVEAGTFVSFYDATPTIETYASEKETLFADMVKDVKVSGKLYVKFANTDSQANAQTLVINGFENKAALNGNQLNENLAVPTNFAENVEAKTPTSVTLTWDANPDAKAYEILVDGTIDEQGNITSGILNSIPATATHFTHTALKYLTTHTYYLRAVNAEGYSVWTQQIEATSANDPFCDSPEPVSEKKITWTGDLYGDHKAARAFNKLFESGDGGFHSGGKAIGEALTVDYDFAYLFDYIEFYPRNDAGNGTPIDMEVLTSLDGVHWINHGNTADENGKKYFHFDRSAEMKHLELTDPYKTDDNANYIGARYIRFIPRLTVGKFFSASEIKPYAIKGESSIGGKQKPWRVGNLSTQGTDKPTVDGFKSVFMKDSSAHLNYKSPQWIAEIRDTYVDVNYNNMSDIWDYTFNGFNVDGSELAGFPIAGDVSWKPSTKRIKKGETFTIRLTAYNSKNISAFGSIINYNPKKVQYVSVAYDEPLFYTDGMTKDIHFEDGTAYINHGAMFLGNKYILSSEIEPKIDLSTITLKALDDITLNNVTDVADPNFVLDLTDAIIISPNHTFRKAGAPAEPDQEKEASRVLPKSAFDVTMTNAALPTDDGTNYTKILQEGMTNDVLFNGKTGREWEFKWDVEANRGPDGKLPAEVALPTTMHFALKEATEIDRIKVFNAPQRGNGYLTKAKAQFTYADGTKSREIVLENRGLEFTFDADRSRKVTNIDVTFLESSGNTAAGEANRMLTLSEIEIITPLQVQTNSINATLKNNIDLNVYLEVSEKAAADKGAYITLATPGSYETKKVMLSDLPKDEVGFYKATISLPARQMNDEVTLKVYTTKANGKVTLDSRETISLAYYLDIVMNPEVASPEQIALVKSLLDYGATAQTYFDYNANNLVNKGKTDEAYKNVTADQFDAYKPVVANNNAIAGVTYKVSNLRLLSDTAIRHHFSVDADAAAKIANGDITFEVVDGDARSVLTPVVDGNKAYVEIEKVFAQDLDKAYTVVVTDKTTGATTTVTYSALSYGYTAMNSAKATPEIKEVVKAMLVYSNAANAVKK